MNDKNQKNKTIEKERGEIRETEREEKHEVLKHNKRSICLDLCASVQNKKNYVKRNINHVEAPNELLRYWLYFTIKKRTLL